MAQGLIEEPYQRFSLGASAKGGPQTPFRNILFTGLLKKLQSHPQGIFEAPKAPRKIWKIVLFIEKSMFKKKF